MAVTGSGRPQVNMRMRKKSYLRLNASEGDFDAATKVKRVVDRAMPRLTFGFRIVFRDPDEYRFLILRLTGRHPGSTLDDPSSGTLLITLESDPTHPVEVPVEYVDDNEDGDDDPEKP